MAARNAFTVKDVIFAARNRRSSPPLKRLQCRLFFHPVRSIHGSRRSGRTRPRGVVIGCGGGRRASFQTARPRLGTRLSRRRSRHWPVWPETGYRSARHHSYRRIWRGDVFVRHRPGNEALAFVGAAPPDFRPWQFAGGGVRHFADRRWLAVRLSVAGEFRRRGGLRADFDRDRHAGAERAWRYFQPAWAAHGLHFAF